MAKNKNTKVSEEVRVSADALHAWAKKGWSLKTKEEIIEYFTEPEILKNATGASKLLAVHISNLYRKDLDKLDEEKPDAIDLAGRYHFLLLDNLLLKGAANVTDSEKDKTFRLYEQKVNDILNGKVSKEELDYLQSLPKTSEWSNNRPSVEKMWDSGYFEGNPPVQTQTQTQIKVNKESLEEKALRMVEESMDGYSYTKKNEVRIAYMNLLDGYQRAYGKENGFKKMIEYIEKN